MKIVRYVLVIALFIVSFGNCFYAYGTPVEVSAKAAIVYAPSTDEIVYEKNSGQKLSMASTTKIMTALIAAEYIEKYGNEIVLITKRMVSVEGSSMGLAIGDKISLYDLCVGMLLASGNDAANAVALYIGRNDFAKIMNDKAKKIGMSETSFVTPSGLDDENHYTTAYDMALLSAAAMDNSTFAEIASSKSMQISYNNGKNKVTLSNHNKLLTMLDDCIGVKTGFTKKSGRCLVSCVERNGIRLICVTLNAPDDWNDHINLYNACYKSVKEYEIKNIAFSVDSVNNSSTILNVEKTDKIYYFTENYITETVFLPKIIYESNNDCYGKIRYYFKDKIIEERNIIRGNIWQRTVDYKK